VALAQVDRRAHDVVAVVVGQAPGHVRGSCDQPWAYRRCKHGLQSKPLLIVHGDPEMKSAEPDGHSAYDGGLPGRVSVVSSPWI